MELLETQLVNAVAPFVLNARLKPLMLRTPERDKHVVNVSAVEGQFYRRFKTDEAPAHQHGQGGAQHDDAHRRAADYHADGIHMNSVDTGWVSDEDPRRTSPSARPRSTASTRRSTSSTAPPASSIRSSPASTPASTSGASSSRTTGRPTGNQPGAGGGSPVPCPRERRRFGRQVALPRAHRHRRRPAARVGAVDRAGRRPSPTGPPATASTWRSRPIFEHLEVFQRVGESHRRRPQGDVRLRGQGRPPRRARAPRAPPASRGRSCSTTRRRRGRSGTSRRTSATSARRRAGTASTSSWVRRCWASTTRSSTSRSSRSRTASTRRSGSATSRLSINSMGDDADRARYAELLRTYLAAPRRRARRRRSASGSRPTRCGCSTPRSPTGRTSSSTRPRSPSTCRRRRAARTSKRCRHGLDRLGIAHEIDAAAGARPRLLHEHHVRVRERGARRRPERHRRRRSLRRAGRGDGRPAHARHRLRHRHRAGADRAATAEGVVARGGADRRRVRASTAWRSATEVTLLVTELREDGMRRRTRLRRPVVQGPDGRWPTGRARASP